MGSIRVGGFGWTNGFGLILSPLEGTQPQLEQPCHRLLPSKLCILENGPKLVTTFRIPKSGFAKREEKNSLLMHALIPAMFSQSIDACPYSCRVFSLLFTTFFLSFFLSILFTLSFLLLCCRGLLPLGSFLFLGPSLWVPPLLSASPSKCLP